MREKGRKKFDRLSLKGSEYMAHFYLSANRFKNNIISAVHQENYNG